MFKLKCKTVPFIWMEEDFILHSLKMAELFFIFKARQEYDFWGVWFLNNSYLRKLKYLRV